MDIKELEKELKKYKDRCNELEKIIDENLTSVVERRVEAGEKYYFIYNDGSTDCDWEELKEVDTCRYEIGNYFKTEEEAEKAVEKIKTYTQLKDLALRLNKGREIDWGNNDQAKYYIYYDYGMMKLDYNNDWSYQRIGQIYCLDIYFLDIAEQEIGEENLRKLFE
jgi:hypothetical protein